MLADDLLQISTIADDPLDEIVALASKLGATAIAAFARRRQEEGDRALEYARISQLLLQHYVFEHQRALGRATQEMSARVRALTIVRSIAETAQLLRDRRAREGRGRLDAWLAIERRKFLMSTRADALAALHARLERDDVHSADAIAREIAGRQLLAWRERLRRELDKSLAELARRGVAELESALGALGEPLSRDAFAGAGLRPAWREPACSSADWTSRLGVLTRAKRRERATAVLGAELEDGSRSSIVQLASEHEDARSAIERALHEMVDMALEAAQRATVLVVRARRSPENLVNARAQIDGWSRALSELAERTRAERP